MLNLRPLIAAVAMTLSVSVQAQMPGGPNQPDMAVDAVTRGAVVDTLVQELKQGYVYPEMGEKLATMLRKADHKQLASAKQLAETLTKEMQALSKDGHLAVFYSAEEVPVMEKDRKPSPEEKAAELAEFRVRNFGVERVERLPFNIAYLDLRAFAPTREAAPALASAMTLVSNANALIIDLRKNGGGEPATVALLASYFFDERTHLNDIHYRAGNRSEQMWTVEGAPGAHFGQQKNVYILTSKGTFSAAEDFSYAMKNLKRATIVGETTGGGAHPGDFIRLGKNFTVFMPNGYSVSPITKTDWEGTGVTPDVAVPAADAFKTAQADALSKLMATKKNPAEIERIKARIAKVMAEQGGI